MALRLEQSPIARILITAGANVNTASCTEHEDGQTPLIFAILQNDPSMVDLLLICGADVNIPDINGYTPLRLAVEYGFTKTIDKLLENGAVDIDITSNCTSSGLHVVCDLPSKRDPTRLAENLLNHGAHVNARDTDGRTPFIRASGKGHLALCKRLIEQGADPLAVDNWSFSALNFAYQEGFLEIVTWHGRDDVVKKILRDLDRDTFDRLCTKADRLTSPPLLTAVRYGNPGCVAILLDAGVDVEIQSEDWETPLILACEMGRLNIVKILVERGAKTRYVNGAGKKISVLGACKWQKPVREWLESHLAGLDDDSDNETIRSVVK
ncbi:hypothetical protein IFR05_010937 [Cadophora sp. M221]|nr:hypothetical protein IFR05_010937 [Cadophora sp. M221]